MAVNPDALQVGVVCINAKGQRRRIVSIGGNAYGGQINTDTLNYIKEGDTVTRPKNITRKSLANWSWRLA